MSDHEVAVDSPEARERAGLLAAAPANRRPVGVQPVSSAARAGEIRRQLRFPVSGH